MDKCITHIRLLESPCPFVRSSGTKFQPHHTHMRYSQGLRMTDASYINASCTYASCTCIMIKEHICICIVQTCIMYICIRVKVSPCMKKFASSYMHPIRLLETPCPSIRPFVRPFVTKFAASYTHAPYIYACFRIKVQDHRYVHHTHMHHSQGT